MAEIGDRMFLGTVLKHARLSNVFCLPTEIRYVISIVMEIPGL